MPNAKLPKAPTRPDQDMVDVNFQKYAWRLQNYDKHIEINRSTIELLNKLFPDRLVRKEVGYKRLPPNLTAKET